MIKYLMKQTGQKEDQMCGEGSMDSAGFTLIIVLMVVCVLTLLGTVAIGTTVVDFEIARSHRELREGFYLAEGAAMEGIQTLINSPAIDRKACFQYWRHSRTSLQGTHLDFTRPEMWRPAGSPDVNAHPSRLDRQTFFLSEEDRVAGGSSLIATGSRLYVERVYGLCKKYNADNLVLVGYYMRY